jgi:hypothetical protein
LATEDEELPLDVHAPIRAGAWDYRWAPTLRALPDLPPELEYQFVGRHLVPVNVRANLVIDVAANYFAVMGAFPRRWPT